MKNIDDEYVNENSTPRSIIFDAPTVPDRFGKKEEEVKKKPKKEKKKLDTSKLFKREKKKEIIPEVKEEIKEEEFVLDKPEEPVLESNQIELVDEIPEEPVIEETLEDVIETSVEDSEIHNDESIIEETTEELNDTLIDMEPIKEDSFEETPIVVEEPIKEEIVEPIVVEQKEEVKKPPVVPIKKDYKKEIKEKQPRDTKIKEEKSKYVSNKGNKIYLGFGARVLIYSLILIFGAFIGTLFLLKSLQKNEEVAINTSEYTNINYQVYLKNNNFYDVDVLDGKDSNNDPQIFVASLIDKINVLFSYNFAADSDIPLDFTYNVKARVVIYDDTEKNVYFQKEYTLIDQNTVSIEDGKYRSISEVVDINYSTYNKVANEFKNTYGIETVSKLIVEFNIQKNGENVSTSDTPMSITIPLSERSISIIANNKDVNNEKIIVSEYNLTVGNVIFIIIAVCLYGASIFFAIKLIILLIKIIPKRNLYDEYVEKIFKEYDRLVVSTTTKPDLNNRGLEKITVLSFQELLDVRDNVKAPIMYYEINKHSKGCFYIKVDNLIYILNVKKTALENKKIK